jgi:hypothetical protein
MLGGNPFCPIPAAGFRDFFEFHLVEAGPDAEKGGNPVSAILAALLGQRALNQNQI